jgi:hypothetical protein
MPSGCERIKQSDRKGIKAQHEKDNRKRFAIVHGASPSLPLYGRCRPEWKVPGRDQKTSREALRCDADFTAEQ